MITPWWWAAASAEHGRIPQSITLVVGFPSRGIGFLVWFYFWSNRIVITTYSFIYLIFCILTKGLKTCPKMGQVQSGSGLHDHLFVLNQSNYPFSSTKMDAPDPTSLTITRLNTISMTRCIEKISFWTRHRNLVLGSGLVSCWEVDNYFLEL